MAKADIVIKRKAPKDVRWAITWVVVIAAVALWNVLFLNKPALALVIEGFGNTMLIALMVCGFTLAYGWIATILLHSFEAKNRRIMLLITTFILNCIRSIPQIIGVLIGYVLIAGLIGDEVLRGNHVIFPLMAALMSLFIFQEMVDLMRERIAHFRTLDFYNAMLVCGISESRIVNNDILWKNSRAHIFNKLISVFGMAVFIQCSVDFIISVGLSTDVSPVDLPVTLGSLLAKIDSKQDILAIGHALTHFDYIGKLFFTHLQGLTIAFCIVFTLLCVYSISNGFSERHRL